MESYYEVRESKPLSFGDLLISASTVIKGFETEAEAKAYIAGIRDGTIDCSMLVDNPDNLFIEYFE